MRYVPLEPQPSRPLTFIVRAETSMLVTCDMAGNYEVYEGRREIAMAMMRLRDHAIYSLVDLTELAVCASYSHWEIIKYRSRYVRSLFRVPAVNYRETTTDSRTRHITTTVYPLASFGSDPLALIPFFEEQASFGVPFGSFSTMARKSWQRTLREPLVIAERFPEGGRALAGPKAFSGGRREALGTGRTYSGTAYLDRPAAYLQAMRGLFPTRLVRSFPQWYEHGIAYADVRVPDRQGWLPLPGVKFGETFEAACYGYGEINGFWTFGELAHARENGADIRIIDAWEGSAPVDLFGGWLDWAFRLRGLPGASGKVAKEYTNRLWGTFGTSFRYKRTAVTFSPEGEPSYRQLPGIPTSRDTAFVAATVASNCRVGLAELLDSGAVWCDTDGGIVPIQAGARLEGRGWKRKEEMEVLDLRSAKSYRYKCMRGVRAHWPINGCVDCLQGRWHAYTDGKGYDDTTYVPARPFEDFFAA